jgi:RNA polymerase sigma-70 factor (ECF subfamily)
MAGDEEIYRSLRPQLFALAYRMVGSVSDAEDLVQEAFLRLQQSRIEADSPSALLTTITTRLAIDHLRSARVRREQYVGPWLPEPLLTEASTDVADDVERADSLSFAFLVVLDTLSPVERAVFLLRDVFAYGYDDIAEIIGKSEANCRQLAVRARRHVTAGKPRFEASHAKREELAQRFIAACWDGETDALVELLASDVVLYGDGGGRAPAAPAPVRGRERVLEFLLGLRRIAVLRNLQIVLAEVNGQPGALVRTPDGEVMAVVSLEIADGRVNALRNVVNPDKLRHLRSSSEPG